MTPTRFLPSVRWAMSLVEVAIAVGLVTFCMVSLMALFPTMLNTVRESREKSLAQRMYQTVSEDLHENPLGAGQNRNYEFDSEGFLLAISPLRPGQTFRSGTMRFTASATNTVRATLPTGHVSTVLVLSRMELKDTERKTTLLQRPVWITPDE